MRSLVMGLHLNAMQVTTASFAQGDDKYAAPSGNQKCVKTGVRHLMVSGMAFSSKRSFCIGDFVDKAKKTSLEGSPRLRGQSWSLLLVNWGFRSRKLEVAVGVWLDCYDAYNAFLTLYEEL
ncbi:hypothetical protein L3X38_031483 [Prunus dulcis]|uniref:Uncharacterized protein n=1 Tax=Prunus dulcis TaxID=3755 RepID=A0AAD4VEF8_PRUDU|nr:hypothetical protein L3X38_031483 [Prunus dulcis]